MLLFVQALQTNIHAATGFPSFDGPSMFFPTIQGEYTNMLFGECPPLYTNMFSTSRRLDFNEGETQERFPG